MLHGFDVQVGFDKRKETIDTQVRMDKSPEGPL